MLSCDDEEYVDMAADEARLPIADVSRVRVIRSKELVGRGLLCVRVGCVVTGEYGD